MKSSRQLPHLIVTATVQPQIASVKLSDPKLRFEQYIAALSDLAKNNFGAVSIIENSGHNFCKEVIKLFPSTPFEFICYRDIRADRPMAELEAMMYSVFLTESTHIDPSRSIIKVTGRYNILNLKDYIDNEPNIALSFRPTINHKSTALLTSIFKLDFNNFRAFEAFLRNSNLSDLPLERLLASYARLQLPKSYIIPYPRISGVSGTFATDYTKNWKERARIFFSGVVPFGLRWE